MSQYFPKNPRTYAANIMKNVYMLEVFVKRVIV